MDGTNVDGLVVSKYIFNEWKGSCSTFILLIVWLFTLLGCSLFKLAVLPF